MNHDQIKTRLFAYHDGELPEEEQAAVAVHVNACDACRAELNAWTRTSEHVFGGVSQPNDVFVGRVMARIRSLEERPALAERLRAAFQRWIYPAIVSVSFAGFAFLTVVSPSEERRLPTDTVLTASQTSGPATWIIGAEHPKESDILDYVMGAQ